jgi:predicted TIM-barrel fold metal-dependent hydrolase
MEPGDLWTKRFPPRLRDRAPASAGDGPLMVVDGRCTSPRVGYPRHTKETERRFEFAASADYSPRTQLEAMDIEGIDTAVLFPSRSLLVMAADDDTDPEITTVAATIYNDWLTEFCQTDDRRLFGVAVVDPRDVHGAVREAERAIGLFPFVAVVLRPNPVYRKPWHHADYEPLWSTLEELGVAVCFHEGAAASLPQVATDRFEQHSFWHVCTHPMEQQMAMLSVLLGGVAERHPRLRFGFLESGAGWLPYWAWRMDEHVEGEPYDFAHLHLRPSEYIERQCFVSIDSDEEPGVFTIETSTNPRVVWGSDYPHRDGKFPHALKMLRGIRGMSSERLRGVVYDAPRRLFGDAVARGAQAARDARIGASGHPPA